MLTLSFAIFIVKGYLKRCAVKITVKLTANCKGKNKSQKFFRNFWDLFYVVILFSFVLLLHCGQGVLFLYFFVCR